MQRLLPPHLFAACALVTGATGWLAPILGPVAQPLRLIGLPLLIFGVAIAVRSASLFDRLDTNITTFDDPGVLVTAGAFRFSRNPMYLGFSLALAGLAGLVGSLSALIGPAAFWLAANHWYIPFEERRMAATFGDAYSEYCAAVRRWIGLPQSVEIDLR